MEIKIIKNDGFMLSKKNIILYTLSFLLLSGCVTSPIKIPEFNDELKVYSSAGHISGFSESAMADHLIDGSQVYLAGNEIFGTFLGLLGVVIDKTRNDTDVVNKGETLAVKFDRLLKDLISSDLKNINKLKIKTVSSKDNADIILLPSARLVVDAEGVASVQFRLTVRFVGPNKTQQSKHYYFDDGKKYRVIGENSWSADGADLLKQHAKTDFNKLLSVLFNDISGEYKSVEHLSDIDFVTYHVRSFVTLNLAILERFDNYVLTTRHNNKKASFRSFMIYPKDFLSK